MTGRWCCRRRGARPALPQLRQTLMPLVAVVDDAAHVAVREERSLYLFTFSRDGGDETRTAPPGGATPTPAPRPTRTRGGRWGPRSTSRSRAAGVRGQIPSGWADLGGGCDPGK